MTRELPATPQGLVNSESRSRTNAAIMPNAARAARVQDATGVGPGDAVALLLCNDSALFEATTAANIIGAHAVPCRR